MKISSTLAIFDGSMFNDTNSGKSNNINGNNNSSKLLNEKNFKEILQEQIINLKERKEVIKNNDNFTVDEKKAKLKEINRELSELVSQLHNN